MFVGPPSALTYVLKLSLIVVPSMFKFIALSAFITTPSLPSSPISLSSESAIPIWHPICTKKAEATVPFVRVISAFVTAKSDDEVTKKNPDIIALPSSASCLNAASSSAEGAAANSLLRLAEEEDDASSSLELKITMSEVLSVEVYR